MSTSLVIVAIPEETDRVWKVSSEPVPHLTLLYLGDDVSKVQNLDQIMQFVEHAVTLSEHGPFYLDVDHRGTLGDAEADVLFFNKRSWNLKWIRQFRGQLLQNQAVRTAFDSTEQILEAPQEWLPHLTLGYPDTPAKELPDNGFDHPLYSVCFDRIAVWAEVNNGPEFRLEWPDRELEGDLAIAYSDQQKAALTHGGRLVIPATPETPASIAERGAAFIEHHGVKGMKWGVRNASPGTPSGAGSGTSSFGGKVGGGGGTAGLLNRKPPKAVAPKATSKVPHGSRRKTKIETDGGENHPAHEDAIRVAKSKAKLKKSGTNALSNQELSELANRIRLEEQATLLTRSAGSKFVRRLLTNQGNQAANQFVKSEVDSRVFKKGK